MKYSSPRIASQIFSKQVRLKIVCLDSRFTRLYFASVYSNPVWSLLSTNTLFYWLSLSWIYNLKVKSIEIEVALESIEYLFPRIQKRSAR